MEGSVSLGVRSYPLFRLFPVSEEDHGTGLALRLALLGCQGSSGIVPNEPASSYLVSSVYGRAWSAACSIDTDLNYDKI